MRGVFTMIKAYSYLLKYSYSQKKSAKKETIREHRSDDFYSTPEAARAKADEFIAKLTSLAVKSYQLTFHEIIIEEHELPEKVTYEGIVRDNGCTYEDYAVLVGDKLSDDIVTPYLGRKVRITLEVIE
jgi:hypothetical protein